MKFLLPEKWEPCNCIISMTRTGQSQYQIFEKAILVVVLLTLH